MREEHRTADVPASLIADAGRALFGERWQQPLAGALGLSLDAKGQNRTIQRWAQAADERGELRVSRSLLVELAQLLERRETASRFVRDAIARALEA